MLYDLVKNIKHFSQIKYVFQKTFLRKTKGIYPIMFGNMKIILERNSRICSYAIYAYS